MTKLSEPGQTTAIQYEDSDVVIVGGGPAGLALASALGSSKDVKTALRVTLVEAGDLSKIRQWAPQQGAFSNRVSSITNASRQFLSDIGAWDHVEQTRTWPVEEMQVWDGVSDARITFTASELGLGSSSEPTQMARLTENLNLQRGLLKHLSGISEVEVLDNVKVSSIRREEHEGGGWPMVHLSNGKILRARLLVGADGFNSPVRSYAGINAYGWAYDTQAIVATLQHPPRTALQAPNTVAYQRFLPTGPIAFLPLSATTSSLVWSTKPALASILTGVDPAVLVSMINAAFRLPEVSMRYLHNLVLDAKQAGTPLTAEDLRGEIQWRERSHSIDEHSAYASGAIRPSNLGIPPEDSDTLPPLVTSILPGTIASFPLRFSHADAYIGEGAGARTVLIGDAAHTVHPLAGQGLNMGLGDVDALARCIENAVLQGGDIGSHTALLPYSQERYFENHKLMAAVDKLHKLYSTTFEPVVWARTVGLEIVNEFDTVKAALMMSAGGKAKSRDAASAWAFAGNSVEGLSRGIGAARVIGQSLAGAVGSSLRRYIDSSVSGR
ncbi:hypothetical protein PLICRDRAFT_94062 [Plicaturopsis crispa FD-325 SS-3]|nr:hypothetical protein PLICRDRAFT_94062 [Plicaturopsis crispa FD-325 SS-3]